MEAMEFDRTDATAPSIHDGGFARNHRRSFCRDHDFASSFLAKFAKPNKLPVRGDARHLDCSRPYTPSNLIHAADLEHRTLRTRAVRKNDYEQEWSVQAAINTRPPRDGASTQSSGSQRTIDGGALAAGKRCDGCTATGRGDGDGDGGRRRIARALTHRSEVVVDLF
jgi:hypothetical protein